MSEMNIKPFQFFTQAILPLDYDDTLSYYECLAKVTAKLNETINVVDVNNENMQSLHDAYVQLESFVNSYFDNLDVQAEIDNKLDEMVTDGTLLELIQPFVDDEIADAVAAWLEENITPTTPAVDVTLLVSGAAADSKTVGDKLKADVAPAYSASDTYSVGDYRLYDHTLYKCNTPISTAEAWTAAHWTAVNVTGEISELNDAVDSINDVVFSEELIIDALDEYSSETVPSSTITKAHPYEFIAGLKYRLKVTVVNAHFKEQTNALRADTSKATGTSTGYLEQALLRINNNQSSGFITNGSVYEAEFTATDDDNNILMRYTFSSGSSSVKIEVYQPSDVRKDIQLLDKNIKNVDASLTQKSRMLMGAHRGAEHFAPPNCVGAYELAGKMGFPWAWLAQVRYSADNTLYVMHDDDVSITTNGTGNMSELTDAYINTLLCNKLSNYDYSKFTEDELRVPTLEQVIQICLRYGMKMCFRIEPLPNNLDSERNQTIWTNFANLIKGYGIDPDWASYSGYNPNEMRFCLQLLGDVEICPYISEASAQDYVDWFDEREDFETVKKAVLMSASNVTLEGVKLLHTNGIRLYAFTNSTTPTQAQMEQLANWGVDILQNPTYAKIPII